MSEKLGAFVAILAAAVILTIVGAVYSACVIQPERMIAKGYCWQTVLVPAQAGVTGTYYSAYGPCTSKDATPVEASK